MFRGGKKGKGDPKRDFRSRGPPAPFQVTAQECSAEDLSRARKHPLELPPSSSSTIRATPSTPPTIPPPSSNPEVIHHSTDAGTALIRLPATPHTSGGHSLNSTGLPSSPYTPDCPYRACGRQFRPRTSPLLSLPGYQMQASHPSAPSPLRFRELLVSKSSNPRVLIPAAPASFSASSEPPSLRTNSDPLSPLPFSGLSPKPSLVPQDPS